MRDTLRGKDLAAVRAVEALREGREGGVLGPGCWEDVARSDREAGSWEEDTFRESACVC